MEVWKHKDSPDHIISIMRQMVTLMLADTGVCWGEVFADLSLLFPLLWSIRSMEEAGAPMGFSWSSVTPSSHSDVEPILFNGQSHLQRIFK